MSQPGRLKILSYTSEYAEEAVTRPERIYSREFLLSLQFSPSSRRKPNWLPCIPGVLLDKLQGSSSEDKSQDYNTDEEIMQYNNNNRGRNYGEQGQNRPERSTYANMNDPDDMHQQLQQKYRVPIFQDGEELTVMMSEATPPSGFQPGRGRGRGRGRNNYRGTNRGRGRGSRSNSAQRNVGTIDRDRTPGESTGGHFRNTSLSRDKRDSSASRSRAVDREADSGMDGQNRKRGRGRIFGYKLLKELADSDNSADVLSLDLLDSKGGFDTLLGGEELKPDWMILLLQILSRVFKTQQKQTLLDLLGLLVSKDFMGRHLVPVLNKIQMKQINVTDLTVFIHNVFALCRTVMERMPDEYLPSCNLILILLKSIATGLNDQSIIKELKDLETATEAVQKQIEERRQMLQNKGGNRQKQSDENLQPPDDFRKLQILPDLNDLDFNQRPFLRVNKAEGSYSDLSHYLDVQFRLLREDFIQPLRQGILHYRMEREHGKIKKIQDIRLYQNVHVVRSICTNDGILHTLQFDVSMMKKVRWESSKRLLYGSLVCLSEDDFETMLFATVTNRDVKDLSNGFIQVRFEQNLERVQNLSPSDSFIMAETTAYYEAYRHILRGLQQIDDDMPFQNYIVRCQSTMKPPKYLQGFVFEYDFRPLLGDNGHEVRYPVLNTRRWPDAHELHLDESQYKALQLAITKEFAIIQGPPGTGKTFVGLKIAKVLLHNKSVWNRDSSSNPILVVCYTNHALDQFLEGILDFCDNIVRIGGRCNTQALEPYRLKNRRRSARNSASKAIAAPIKKRKYDCRRQMAEVRDKIENTSNKLYATRLGIMHEDTLRKYMRPCHYDSLCRVRDSHSPHILDWLRISTESNIGITDIEDEDILEKEPIFSTWKNIILNYDIKMDPTRAMQMVNLWTMQLEDRIELYTLWKSMATEQIKKKIEEFRKRKRFSPNENSIRMHIQEYNRILETSENSIMKEEQLFTYLPDNLKSILLKIRSGQPKQLFRRANQTLIEEWLCLDGTQESRESIQNALKVMSCEDDELIDVDEEVTAEEKERIIDEENEEDDFFSKQIQNANSSLDAALSDLAILGFDPGAKHIKDREKSEWTSYSSKGKKKMIKKILFGKSRFTKDEVDNLDDDVWVLTFDEREKLYRSWLLRYEDDIKASILEIERSYSDACESYREAMDMEDVELIKDTDVVAMTTTGAAKFRSILQTIKPRIVIVEEAAEVLESHIITTLNKDCEHLILIGDHKQLRPTPTVYHLATKYNLEISLFERMVNNRLNFETLDIQHRMRPEISVLMKHIYPSLTDHPSVMKYPNILGVDCNIFFITHKYEEQYLEENKSRSNIHEAKFVVELCRYFINQGYNPSQITILTTYNGQVFQLKRLMPKSDFQGVRVTAVDNFQGEENDIIILSLVRSNIDSNIGFLKIDNRICVALSRARQGLYIIGNMDSMAGQSPMWANIDATLKERKAIGSHLLLRCQNHNEQKTPVSTDLDFVSCRDGGCSRPCNAKLSCGHSCKKSCHVFDKNHLLHKCLETCGKTVCSNGHKCRKKCFQECGECEELIDIMLPVCLHRQKIPCSKNPYTVECKQPCSKTLVCGHQCTGICGACKKLNKHQTCKISCARQLSCGHTVEIPCSQPVDQSYPCPKQCEATLNCGHKCSGTCYDCFGGRIHVACQAKCKEMLICGHVCQQECGKPCTLCLKRCQNKCQHSDCKDKCGVPCKGCVEKCDYACRHESCKNLCHEPCNRLPCTEPCTKSLDCKHNCMGLCGEPCPPICYVCNESKAKEIYPNCTTNTKFVILNDCKHIFECKSLDKWILKRDIWSTGTYVEMLQCPKCRKPISNSQRYGRVTKTLKRDVEKIKESIHIDENGLKMRRRNIIARLKQDKLLDQSTLDRILVCLEDNNSSNDQLDTIENQILLLAWLADIRLLWNKTQLTNPVDCLHTQRYLDRVQHWIYQAKLKPNKSSGLVSTKRKYFSKTELQEVGSEILRLEFLVKFIIKLQDTALDFTGDPNIKPIASGLLNALKDGKPLDSNREKIMKSAFSRLENLQSRHQTGIVLECPERKENVKSREFVKGKWCKCLCDRIFHTRDENNPLKIHCPNCKQSIDVISINDEPYLLGKDEKTKAAPVKNTDLTEVKKASNDTKHQWKTVTAKSSGDKNEEKNFEVDKASNDTKHQWKTVTSKSSLDKNEEKHFEVDKASVYTKHQWKTVTAESTPDKTEEKHFEVDKASTDIKLHWKTITPINTTGEAEEKNFDISNKDNKTEREKGSEIKPSGRKLNNTGFELRKITGQTSDDYSNEYSAAQCPYDNQFKTRLGTVDETTRILEESEKLQFTRNKLGLKAVLDSNNPEHPGQWKDVKTINNTPRTDNHEWKIFPEVTENKEQSHLKKKETYLQADRQSLFSESGQYENRQEIPQVLPRNANTDSNSRSNLFNRSMLERQLNANTITRSDVTAKETALPPNSENTSLHSRGYKQDKDTAKQSTVYSKAEETNMEQKCKNCHLVKVTDSQTFTCCRCNEPVQSNKGTNSDQSIDSSERLTHFINPLRRTRNFEDRYDTTTQTNPNTSKHLKEGVFMCKKGHQFAMGQDLAAELGYRCPDCDQSFLLPKDNIQQTNSPKVPDESKALTNTVSLTPSAAGGNSVSRKPVAKFDVQEPHLQYPYGNVVREQSSADVQEPYSQYPYGNFVREQSSADVQEPYLQYPYGNVVREQSSADVQEHYFQYPYGNVVREQSSADVQEPYLQYPYGNVVREQSSATSKKQNTSSTVKSKERMLDDETEHNQRLFKSKTYQENEKLIKSREPESRDQQMQISKEDQTKRRAACMWFRCKQGHLYDRELGDPDINVCKVCGDSQGKTLI